MCDICQVESVLSKYFGLELARQLPIERIVDETTSEVGYCVAFGGYWVCNETAETFPEAVPKVERWAHDFTSKIFALQLEANPVEGGVAGKFGPVSFQMLHDGTRWSCEIGGKPFILKAQKINAWIDEIKRELETTSRSYN